MTRVFGESFQRTWSCPWTVVMSLFRLLGPQCLQNSQEISLIHHRMGHCLPCWLAALSHLCSLLAGRTDPLSSSTGSTEDSEMLVSIVWHPGFPLEFWACGFSTILSVLLLVLRIESWAWCVPSTCPATELLPRTLQDISKSCPYSDHQGAHDLDPLYKL